MNYISNYSYQHYHVPTSLRWPDMIQIFNVVAY